MAFRYFNTNDISAYNATMQAANERALFESHNISRKSASDSTKKSVFLSHSSADRAALPAVIQLLESLGVNVYIDKIDQSLPQQTSPETGRKLKERIHQCDKFIVLVSEHSKDSRWIPWELGIADENKTIRNVALLPKVNSSEIPNWAEQEYMGLYHRITYGGLEGYSQSVWMVYDQSKNQAVELKQWLNQ